MRSKRLLLLVSLTVGLFQACSVNAAESEAKKTPAPFTVTVTGSGRPMIFIPGLGCGSNVWDGAVAHFKDSYQCHLVTLAGFAGQPAIGEPFLKQVRDGLGKYIREHNLERPIIIGHSLGGFLAYWLSSEMPDQTGPIIAVDGVPYYPALLDASTTPQLQKPMAEMLRNRLKMQAPLQFAIGNQLNLATMISDAKEVERVAELSNRSDPKAVAQAIYEVMTIDLREQVNAIRSPVLLLAGTNPTSDSEEQKRAEESYRLQVTTIPKHKVVFASNSRHFIQLDVPAFFFAQVESFLSETSETKNQ